MKKSIFAALAAGLVLVACAPKSEPAVDDTAKALEQGGIATPPEVINPTKPSKSQVDSVSYLIGVNFGSMIKGNNFGDLNYKQIVKGIKDFVGAEGSPYSEGFDDQFKIAPSCMNEVINTYLQQRQAYIADQNKVAGEKYLESNKAQSGVQVTESGLQYKVVEAGDETIKPAAADTVLVRYKGETIDGNVFDEVAADAEPIRLVLNHVIPGWTEGVQLIGKGGKIQLVIPASLGYGERGNQAIGPNSVLKFDVELVDVIPFVAPEQEKDTTTK